MAPKLVCSRDSRMSSIHMSQLFRFIPFLFSLAALFGCSGGGSGGPDSAPLSISASGIEGGVILKKASTGEEWTITENGTVSIGDFALDSDIEISVKPTSALQVCRLNGQSDSVTVRATELINIECDNKMLFASLSEFTSETSDEKLWILDEHGGIEVLVEGRNIRLFSKIGLLHYFQVGSTLFKTDGTIEGSVPFDFAGQVFSSRAPSFNDNNDVLFFITKDSGGKEYLYDIDSDGLVKSITLPEGILVNELSIAKIEGSYVFYNRTDKQFFAVDVDGSLHSIFVLEGFEEVISAVIYDNDLLILSMDENGVRKLQSISPTGFELKTIPLPTAPKTSIYAGIYGDNTLLFIATQPEEGDKTCKIIYRYNNEVFETLVDYCNERTTYIFKSITYQHSRLLLIEISNATGVLYELSELDLVTTEQRTLLSNISFEGGVSEMIPMKEFLFVQARSLYGECATVVFLCYYQVRHYSWQYQTEETVELVAPYIEIGVQWMSWQVSGNWDFDKARIFESVYFPYKHQAFGLEPWMSDGTIEGTKIVKDIKPGTEFGLFPDVERELFTP